MMIKTLLSIGHGYSAQAFGRLAHEHGWRVIGTTRSDEKAKALAQIGVEPLVWPGQDISAALGAASHVLTSVAPGDDGDPVLAALGADIEAAAPHLEWVGYLSTTGVYGDHGGEWVDETTPLAPSTERGRQRVAAEAEWQKLAERAGFALHIFRLAGIYGPGRGPFSKVKSGKARRIIKPGQVFSRIHVEDIGQVLMASALNPRAGAIYNVCDDDPAPPQDVIAYAADLLGVPRSPQVPFDEAEMSAMARSFYAESKRVRNDLLKSDLGVRLRFPSYREGLSALLEEAEADS